MYGLARVLFSHILIGEKLAYQLTSFKIEHRPTQQYPVAPGLIHSVSTTIGVKAAQARIPIVFMGQETPWIKKNK